MALNGIQAGVRRERTQKVNARCLRGTGVSWRHSTEVCDCKKYLLLLSDRSSSFMGRRCTLCKPRILLITDNVPRFFD